MEELRLSYYTIPVKLESEKNKYLLVHGYTGAIDIVDGEIWMQMKSFSSQSKLSVQAIRLLERRGYFTSRTKEEEINYVTRLAQLLHKSQSKLFKSFGFVVSYNCNFRCSYCFESEVSNHGLQWTKQTFTKEMVDKAYAAMLNIAPQERLRCKTLILYGGEPLLRENQSVVDYIVRKGGELGFKFKVITNGYDIDYFEDIISPDYFNLVQITLDGGKECHNSRRFHYEEGDSFEKIITNIGFVLSKGVNVTIRVNTDERNFNDIKELKQLFDELGYSQNPLFELHSSVIRKYDNNTDYTENINFLSMDTFNQKMYSNDFSKQSNCQDFGIFKRFYKCLKNRSRYQLSSAACSAQYGSFLFDPYGSIYSCLETIGKKEHIIGHYNSSVGVTWTENRKKWFERNTGNSQNCQKCKYALFCGGGCLAHSKHTDSGFGLSYCNHYKAVFPISINKAYIACKCEK